MLRLALDQSFPTPIIEALREYILETKLASVREIDKRLPTLDDWELLLALHQTGEWDGLVTTDAAMLALPREMSVLLQTKLTLVVTEGAGNDPIRATGLLLAHLPNICRRSRPDEAQVWRLRVGHPPHEDPWKLLDQIAKKTGGTAKSLYQGYRLSKQDLAERRSR